MNRHFLLSLVLLISTTAYTADNVRYKVNKKLPTAAWEITRNEDGKEVKTPLKRLSPVVGFTIISNASCNQSCADKAKNCATKCSHGGPVGDIEDL